MAHLGPDMPNIIFNGPIRLIEYQMDDGRERGGSLSGPYDIVKIWSVYIVIYLQALEKERSDRCMWQQKIRKNLLLLLPNQLKPPQFLSPTFYSMIHYCVVFLNRSLCFLRKALSRFSQKQLISLHIGRTHLFCLVVFP